MKEHPLLNIRNLFIPLVLFFLFFPFFSLPAQQKKLDVDGDLRIHSPDSGPESGKFKSGLSLVPQMSIPGGVCDSGTLVYCAVDKRPYGCLNGAWYPLGVAADKYEATFIVAAYNSIGSNSNGVACDGLGGACSNPRADYTCDGSDDQYVINRAINELPVNGGMVYLLEGTYNISSNNVGSPLQEGPGVVLDRNSLTLMGAGGATVLKINHPSGSFVSGVEVLRVPSTHSSSIQDILITQLTIDGNNKIGDTYSNQGISLYGGATGIKNVRIDKVWVKEIDGHGIYALNKAENITVTDSFIRNNAGYGVNIVCNLATDTNRRVYITGNSIRDNSRAGVRIWGTGNSEDSIQRNNIISNGQSGIALSAAAYATVGGNNIAANGVNNDCADISAGCHGIYLENMNAPGYRATGYTTDSALICENNISGNKGNGIKLANNAYHILMIRNNLVDNDKQGIYLYKSKYNFITNSVIKDSGSTSLDKRGIETGIDCSENHISGNRISFPLTTNDNYGIYIGDNGTGAPNNYLYANKIDNDNPSMNSYQLYNYNTDSGLSGQVYGGLFTDKFALSLRQASVSYSGAWNFDPKTQSVSFLEVSGAGGTGIIQDGIATGDILIVACNDPSATFTLANGGNISLSSAQIDLQNEDTLMLFWDGSKWVMIGGSDN